MNQHARIEHAPIPFIDVAAQRRRLGPAIDDAIARVTAHCQFIDGPEVEQFERELAAFCGAGHAVSCASGTDALVLVLMAQRIGPGDAVMCPAFTFCATAEVVVLVGATPVFADVDADTFNLDPHSLRRAVLTARARGLKPKAVIPVDLFGLPADHDAIAAVAAAEGLFVLDDAAQAFGATWNGRKLGTLAPATATSFFPAKPLGCYGDGGAVLTDDEELVGHAAQPARARPGHRQIRQRPHRHDQPARHHSGGGADREAEDFSPTRSRRATGSRGAMPKGLRTFAIVPGVPDGATSVWAQYTIRLGTGPARRACRRAQGAGHSDRDLLSQAAAPAGGLSPLPGGGQRHSGDRPAGRGGHQPADARLSRSRDAGPHHRGCQQGPPIVTSLPGGGGFPDDAGTGTVAVAVLLALGGCSMSELLPRLTPEDIAGPEPQYRFLIAGRIKSIVGDPAGLLMQISTVRRADSLKGASWLACIKVQPFALALPHYYAVYIQQQRIVESRLSVLLDQCEIQTYTPFDWAREAEGPAK